MNLKHRSNSYGTSATDKEMYFAIRRFALIIAMAGTASSIALAQVPSTLQQHLLPSDSQGREMGTDLDADDRTLVVGGGARVYVYEFTSQGWSNPQILIAASERPGQNEWGFGVAVSGDLIAVGSQGEQNQNGSVGAVHIYRRISGNHWTFASTVTSPDTNDSARFGASFDLEGSQLVAGDPEHRFGGPFPQGAAYVFSWNGTSFIFDQKLFSTTAPRSDSFSQSISLSGDWLIIGAPAEDHDINLNDSGAVHAFRKTAGIWSNTARFEALSPQIDAHFGQALSLGEDFAIVGSQNRVVNGQAVAGAAYIVRGGDWTEVAYFTAENPVGHEQLGVAVSISGNIAIASRTGHTPVGAPQGSGSARIFKRVGREWHMAEDIVAPDADSADAFGSSVLIHRGQIIVGAGGDNVMAPDGTIFDWGSTYVFGGGSVSDTLFADGFEVR